MKLTDIESALEFLNDRCDISAFPCESAQATQMQFMPICFESHLHYYAMLREAVRTSRSEYKAFPYSVNELYNAMPEKTKDELLIVAQSSGFYLYDYGYKTAGFILGKTGHYLHMSANQPGLVAYTESADKAIRDIQTVTKLGRYLTKHMPDVFSPESISAIAAFHAAKCAPDVLEWHDGEGIQKIYKECGEKDTVKSCMTYPDGDFDSDINPTIVYATADFKLAVIRQSGAIKARALVFEASKQYGRIYGNEQALGEALQAAGYTRASYMPDGLRIRRIDMDGGAKVVLPYMDNCSSVSVTNDPHYLYTGRVSGARYALSPDSTDGVCRRGARYSCSNCNCDLDEDEGFGTDDGTVCESCYSDLYCEAYGRRGYTETALIADCIYCEDNDRYYTCVDAAQRDDLVLVNDEWRTTDNLSYCEHSEEWHDDSDCVVVTRYNGDEITLHIDYTYTSPLGETLYIEDKGDYDKALACVGGYITLVEVTDDCYGLNTLHTDAGYRLQVVSQNDSAHCVEYAEDMFIVCIEGSSLAIDYAECDAIV